MYRSLDVPLLRMAVVPTDVDLPPWPDLDDNTDSAVAGWTDWLRDIWARPVFADATTLASPSLAARVASVLDGQCHDRRAARRAVTATARYVLRMVGRATPFGLFAGVAPAGFGPRVRVRLGDEHRVHARPGGGWLAALADDLEACDTLLRRLPVATDGLSVARGDRLFTGPAVRPGNDAGQETVAEVSVRRTPAVEAALRHATRSLPVADLVTRLAADAPAPASSQIEAMLIELVRRRFLHTPLRPATTFTDPFGEIVDQLAAAQVDNLPPLTDRLSAVRDLRDLLTHHNNSRSASDRRALRAQAADLQRRVVPSSDPDLDIDLVLDTDVILPAAVTEEAGAAARALARLTTPTAVPPEWADWHEAFLERYGPAALVPLLEAVNPDTGLGLPATFRGSTRTSRPGVSTARDHRLAALAQRAVLDGTIEVRLGEAEIVALAGDTAPAQVPPHAELIAEVHAHDPTALSRGLFTLRVTGGGRTAATTTGRFLHLLDPASFDRFRNTYAALPTMRGRATVAQVSCPPLPAATVGVARSPQLTDTVITLAEHHDTGPGVLRPADLAVGADAEGLYLVSLPDRRLVEPSAAHAVEFRYHTHPLARFLCELPTARVAVSIPFSWGTVGGLPFLPRLVHRRTVLAPARWNLTAADLPGRAASVKAWRGALARWGGAIPVPTRVQLVETDNRLRLDLHIDAHLVLLRDHLQRHGSARLDEDAAPGTFGWLGGHAHELVIPLATTAAPLPGPAPERLAATVPVARTDAQLPGVSPWLSARLYGHPDRLTELLAHLDDLLDEWPNPPAWWFLPYRDTEPHLRLRLAVTEPGGYGLTAARLGTWAATQREAGLLSNLHLDTYHPETGRYGYGPAMTAAEAVFSADSAAALATRRLAASARLPVEAITVAGLVDMAIAFTRAFSTGMRWLRDVLPHEPARVPRAERTVALHLANPADGFAYLRAVPGADAVLSAWQTRAAALAAYWNALAAQRPPDQALASLLHLHAVRTLGLNPAAEQTCIALARATAARALATTEATVS
ncbi:lantibiotic dehydratase [Parafrankia colletiae]|uniref:Lantibiotic dehydratase n=1 Tax=Parafrankia colletiae TaxID=573497 RepID=A0A1S1Q3B3_9ACTN|nr:lantibiotic dehydratase [Parafrankia colletiae]MCK9904430.1 lantibiotic dehydratase [Frankia sp. Cpl3]OHV28057.1 lantibiotic dehydratase [Parafrankia colletiae]